MAGGVDEKWEMHKLFKLTGKEQSEVDLSLSNSIGVNDRVGSPNQSSKGRKC